MGRLPPVLHALPLPAAAAGGEGRALPALAARLDRRHHAAADARADVVPRPLPPGHVHATSSCTPGSRRATRTGPSRSSRRSSGVFKKELFVANVRKMRKLVERLEWDPPEGVWTAYGERNSYTDDDARRKDEFVREVATVASLEPRLGHRREQRPLLAHRRRGRQDGGGRRRRPGPGRAALPRPARGGQRADPHAHDEPGRPLAGARLARARAQGAARPRQARPGAGARARSTTSRSAPTCRSRSSWTGWPRSARALVIEFPTREDPMVKKLLAPKRDGLHPDYELGFFERTPGRGLRGRALRAARVGHARALLRPAEAADDRRGGGAPSARPRAPRSGTPLGLPRNLAVLWTFAVAQPLFDLLKDNPEFFAARGSSGFDVISFVGAAGGAAAGAAAGDRAAGRAWPARRAREGAHLVLIAGLASR